MVGALMSYGTGIRWSDDPPTAGTNKECWRFSYHYAWIGWSP